MTTRDPLTALFAAPGSSTKTVARRDDVVIGAAIG
jgi:hypothetical protein